jgi:hypothetical protein
VLTAGALHQPLIRPVREDEQSVISGGRAKLIESVASLSMKTKSLKDE